MKTIEVYQGRYCVECKTLCSTYEQGLCCNCGQHWETEVRDEEKYPEKWELVTVTISK